MILYIQTKISFFFYFLCNKIVIENFGMILVIYSQLQFKYCNLALIRLYICT